MRHLEGIIAANAHAAGRELAHQANDRMTDAQVKAAVETMRATPEEKDILLQCALRGESSARFACYWLMRRQEGAKDAEEAPR